MNLHKHQLYLLEQDSESFKIWSMGISTQTTQILNGNILTLYRQLKY